MENGIVDRCKLRYKFGHSKRVDWVVRNFLDGALVVATTGLGAGEVYCPAGGWCCCATLRCAAQCIARTEQCAVRDMLMVVMMISVVLIFGSVMLARLLGSDVRVLIGFLLRHAKLVRPPSLQSELRERALVAKVVELKARCAILEAECRRRERDETRARAERDDALRARTAALKAASDARADALETAALLAGDPAARKSALARLRRSPGRTPAIAPALAARTESPPALTPTVAWRDTDSSDLPELPTRKLTKTPSENYLLSLQPNLSAGEDTDSECDADGDITHTRTHTHTHTVSAALVRAQPAAPRTPVKRARRRRMGRSPLALSRAPWVDALQHVTHRRPFSIEAEGMELDGVFARTDSTTLNGSGSASSP